MSLNAQISKFDRDSHTSQLGESAPGFTSAVRLYLTKNENKGHQRKSYFYLEACWTRIFRETPVNEISTTRLETLLEEQRSRWNWNPATSNGNIGQVGGLFSFCLRRGWIEHHPIHNRIERYKADNAREAWFTAEDVEKLKSKSPAWLADMIAFAFGTGLRRSNVLGLRVQDYKLEPDGKAFLDVLHTKNGDRLRYPLVGKVRDLVEWSARFRIASPRI